MLRVIDKYTYYLVPEIPGEKGQRGRQSLGHSNIQRFSSGGWTSKGIVREDGQ